MTVWKDSSMESPVLSQDAPFPEHRNRVIAQLESTSRTDRVVCHVILLALCLGVLAASVLLRADGEGLSLFGYAWPFHCWLYETLGVRCALCGMSRSFCSLAHGDVQSSLGFHPLGVAVFAVFCLEVPYRVYGLLALPGRIDARVVKIHFGLVSVICAAIFFHWLFYLGGLIA